MSEENKALVRRAWELADNPDILDEVYAPDVVWHEPDQEIRGLEQAKQFVTTYNTSFPDMNVTVEDVIAEGDKVVTRVTLRGTHQGETEEFGPPHWQAGGARRHHHQPNRRGQDSRGLGQLRQFECYAAAWARSRAVAGRHI